MGCLTTGDLWDFYFLRQRVNKNADDEDVSVGYDLLELTDVTIHGEDGISNVMGICLRNRI